MGADRLLLRRIRAAAGGGGVVVALALAAPAAAQSPDPSPGAARPAPDPYGSPAPAQEPHFVAPTVIVHPAAPTRLVQRRTPPRHRPPGAHRPKRTALQEPRHGVRPTLPARLFRPPAEWIVTAGVPLGAAVARAERVPRSAALGLAALVLLSAAFVLHAARKSVR